MLSDQATETIGTFSSGDQPACPVCGNTRSYALADGRMKCAVCRRVYTPTPRLSRLTDEQLTGLANSFWSLSSTAETAATLGLNIKTVQRYFQLIRHELAAISEQEAGAQCGTASIAANLFQQFGYRGSCGVLALPIAALVATAATVRILMVSEDHRTTEQALTMPSGWLYGRDPDSLAKCQLDRIHVTAAADELSLLMPFWQFVKRGLGRYQGGFRHNFPLYLREMEFRYNRRSDPSAADTCMQLLKKSLQ